MRDAQRILRGQHAETGLPGLDRPSRGAMRPSAVGSVRKTVDDGHRRVVEAGHVSCLVIA